MSIKKRYEREILIQSILNTAFYHSQNKFCSSLRDMQKDLASRITFNGAEYVACLCVFGLESYLNTFISLVKSVSQTAYKDELNKIARAMSKWESEVFQDVSNGYALRDYIKERSKSLSKHYLLFYFSLRGYFVTRNADNPDILANQTLVCAVLDILTALYTKVNLHKNFIPKFHDLADDTYRPLTELIEAMDFGEKADSIQSEPCRMGIEAIYNNTQRIMHEDLRKDINIYVTKHTKM